MLLSVCDNDLCVFHTSGGMQQTQPTMPQQSYPAAYPGLYRAIYSSVDVNYNKYMHLVKRVWSSTVSITDHCELDYWYRESMNDFIGLVYTYALTWKDLMMCFDWTQYDWSSPHSVDKEEWSLVSTLWWRTGHWSPLLAKMCCHCGYSTILVYLFQQPKDLTKKYKSSPNIKLHTVHYYQWPVLLLWILPVVIMIQTVWYKCHMQ